MYDLYSSLNIILVIKSRMRWTEHVACMGEIRNAYKLFVAKPEERENVEELGIGERTILKRIFNKRDGVWTGLMWVRIGTGGGLLLLR
jgi:hypothetical protein